MVDELKLQLPRNVGGRPRGHAGREIIESKWEELSPHARKMALYRHTCDIKKALTHAGCSDWLPSGFALALKSQGVLSDLMRSKAIANIQFDLLEHLAGLLAAEWDAKLALFL
eukprot:4348248-Pleurochrysis_carterae.AAC.1